MIETEKSGYSVYNPAAKRRRRLNPLSEVYPPLPKNKYQILYVDPPWDYGGKMQYDLSAIKKHNENFDRPVFISAADFKYPTLKTAELKELPLLNIADEDCLLFLWTTGPHLASAVELGAAWGFEYKTVAFVWDKMIHNPGRYTLSQTEQVLVFKRGKIPVPRGARNVRQLVAEKRGKHSEKPRAVRDGISAMFPEQNKIELFARQSSEGWDTWGLDMIDEFTNDELFRGEEGHA